MTLEELWKQEVITSAVDSDPSAEDDPVLRHPIRRAIWLDRDIAVILGPGLTLLIGRVADVRVTPLPVPLRAVGSTRPPKVIDHASVKHIQFGMPWSASYEDMVATDWEIVS